MPASNEGSVIFVIDDDAVVREFVALVLASEGFAVEARAGGAEFLATYGGERGCAIVDLHMPGMDGLRLQEEMSENGILLPIIFLSGGGDIPSTVRAIKAGAVDFLTKPVRREVLLSSIRSALELGNKVSAEVDRCHEASSRMTALTKRETEVMELVIAGLSNKEVGKALGISHRTVEIHKGRIMQKTGATSLLGLAQLAQACLLPASGLANEARTLRK